MIFDSAVTDFLAGRTFSNGLKVKVAEAETGIVDRTAYIEQIVRGAKVVHFGCADHIPLIAQKRRAGRWLHERLVGCSARCVGVDNDPEAVVYLREELGYAEVLCHDIIAHPPATEIREVAWDYAVLGEILEHVDDPVSFLTSLHEKYSSCIEKLVVTVPNAFRLANFRHCFQNVELINTDHRYWFSPFTLSKVAVQAGWEVEQFQLCQSYPARGRLRQLALRRYPLFRETIVAILR